MSYFIIINIILFIFYVISLLMTNDCRNQKLNIINNHIKLKLIKHLLQQCKINLYNK